MGRNEAENLTATTAPGAQYSLKSSPGEDRILQKMLDSIDEVIALEDSGKITPDQARERADAATHTAMEAISELRMRKRSEEPPARAIVTPDETTQEEVNTVGALSKDIQHLLAKAEKARKQLEAEVATGAITHEEAEAQQREMDCYVMDRIIYLQGQTTPHPPGNSQKKKLAKSNKKKCFLVTFFIVAFCIFSSFIIGAYYANYAESKGYNTGYDAGYEVGVSDTKSNYAKPSGSSRATVYITSSGTKYHEKGCSYLSSSAISISLEDAKEEGYTACSRCNPPD